MAHLTRSPTREFTLWTQSLNPLTHSESPAVSVRKFPGRCASRRLYPVRAKPELDSELTTEIENLDRNYCDDFICTSSPAVEQTVKAFAVDLLKATKWTLSRFAQDVEYKVMFRDVGVSRGSLRLDLGTWG